MALFLGGICAAPPASADPVQPPTAADAATLTATGVARTAARCERPLPIAGRPQGFRHMRNRLTLDRRAAQHRGYDAFVRAGEPQWVTATFAYDVRDARMQDEDVDVFVLRDCARWEPLGTARTSRRGDAVRRGDGAAARDGGRVALEVPAARRLGPGLHRVRFVVRADHSAADAWIDVLPAGARFVVSDVDGTLVEGEFANIRNQLGMGRAPRPNPGAAATLRTLAQQGYRVYYLTGRPDFVSGSTHAWLTANGFPAGVLRTREGTTLGMGGPDTAAYKSRELVAASRIFGRTADYAFGNTPIDVRAYAAGNVAPARRFFFQLDGERGGGQRLADYRVLAASLATQPAAPRPPAAVASAASALAKP